MTEKNTTLIIAEKVKAFAMAFIGSAFITIGSTYFSEHSSYYIPRILLPVYSVFGNTGLAIGMLALGLLLIIYAFLKFKKHGGQPITFIAFQVVSILVFGVIIYTTNKKPSTVEVSQYFEEQEQIKKKMLDDVERPKLDNAKANTYLDNLENLLAKMEKAKSENNKAALDEHEKEYTVLTGSELSTLISELSTTDKYSDFIKYNAKILDKIDKIRLKQ